MSKKSGKSPIVQIRVPKNILAQWDQFCDKHVTTRSEFLKYAGNLLVNRPELWENPQAGQDNKAVIDTEEIKHALQELKKLILEQRIRIDSLQAEKWSKKETGWEQAKGYFFFLLRDRVLTILKDQSLTIDEIKAEIPDPNLQEFVVPEEGGVFSLLDDVITDLLEKKEIVAKDNRYTASL